MKFIKHFVLALQTALAEGYILPWFTGPQFYLLQSADFLRLPVVSLFLTSLASSAFSAAPDTYLSSKGFWACTGTDGQTFSGDRQIQGMQDRQNISGADKFLTHLHGQKVSEDGQIKADKQTDVINWDKMK